MNPSNQLTSKVNSEMTASMEVSASGSFAFSNMAQIMEFARIMSMSRVAIPKHLREDPGACLAVCIQASEWQFSPFAVANKSYSVNDRLAYEAQLINAVILRRAPIKGRFAVSYIGTGIKRQCKVVATPSDGCEPLEYLSPEIGMITVKNSPLWKADPDQQLFYYSSRALCRRHFPDVILGVYTQDELAEESGEMREVTKPQTAVERLAARRAAEEQQSEPVTESSPIEAQSTVIPADPSGEDPTPEEEAEHEVEMFTDFMLSVSEETDAENLSKRIEECASFGDQKTIMAAKKAVHARATLLGFEFDPGMRVYFKPAPKA